MYGQDAASSKAIGVKDRRKDVRLQLRNCYRGSDWSDSRGVLASGRELVGSLEGQVVVGGD